MADELHPIDNRDRYLLFGVLATQLGWVRPNQMAEAGIAWTQNPAVPLDEHLARLGVLSDRLSDLLHRLTRETIAAHGGDAHQALATLGGPGRIHEAFHGALFLDSEDRLSTYRYAGDEIGDANISVGEESPGRYTLVSEYAKGGMGRVLIVHDLQLGRNIALKELLPPPTVAGSENADEAELTPVRATAALSARFLQEARITGRLEHPSIVPVYELGRRHDGTLYYTMKLVRGRTFYAAIKECRSFQQRVELLPHFLNLCQALAYAHSRSVIHRDIKPANVMVGEFGETVVLDWGLAKSLNHSDVHEAELARLFALAQSGGATPDTNTVYGNVLGTPNYMPPEQAKGIIDLVDARSDVYSLGAVLYELITGIPPYRGSSNLEVITLVIQSEPRPVSELVPNVPAELAAICRKAMCRDPADRYSTARELADDVQRFLTGSIVLAHDYRFAEHLFRHVRRHKTSYALAASALALILALGGFYNYQLYNARESEHEQRLEAEKANRMLTWENYAANIQIAHKYIDELDVETASRILLALPEQHRRWEWGHLYNRCRPNTFALFDNDLPEKPFGFVSTAAYSNDDRFVLQIRPFVGLVQVFDLLAGRNVYLLRVNRDRHHSHRGCVRFHPGNRKFTLAIGDRRVAMWSFDPDKPVSETGVDGPEPEVTFEADDGLIASFVFSPDGEQAAGFIYRRDSACSIRLWDANSGNTVAEHSVGKITSEPSFNSTVSEAWEETVYARQGSVIGYSADGRVLFVDERAGALDPDTGVIQYMGPCRMHADYQPEPDRMAILRANNRIDIWDVTNNRPVLAFDIGDSASIQAMALSRDGLRVATAGHLLEMWNTADRKPEWMIRRPFRGIQFSANGNGLHTFDTNRIPHYALLPVRHPEDAWEIQVEMPPNGKPAFDHPKRTEAPIGAVAPDGSRFFAGGLDGWVQMWSVPDFTLLAEWMADGERVRRVVVDPSGKRLATAGHESVTVWDLDTRISILRIEPREGDVMTSCSFSADGSRIAVGSWLRSGVSSAGERQAWVVDIATGEKIYEVEGHPGMCNFVQFSPDGKWLFTGTYGPPNRPDVPSIYIWDAASGSQLHGSIAGMNWPWNASFSADGTRVVAVGLTLVPVMFDLTEMKEIYRVSHDNSRQVSFFPDGDRFVVFRFNGYSIHAATDGRELYVSKEGHTQGFISQDGRTVYIAKDNEAFLAFGSADWKTHDPEQMFQSSLQKARSLLGLDTGSSP
ncbi:MAG: hypothetical protein AMXMBFR84_05590 [Candidatus Hydrogenedentota bacterium]